MAGDGLLRYHDLRIAIFNLSLKMLNASERFDELLACGLIFGGRTLISPPAVAPKILDRLVRFASMDLYSAMLNSSFTTGLFLILFALVPKRSVDRVSVALYSDDEHAMMRAVLNFLPESLGAVGSTLSRGTAVGRALHERLYYISAQTNFCLSFLPL